MNLVVEILILTSYLIVSLISDSADTIGSSCELNTDQIGTCSRIKDCPYAKSLIQSRKRPNICEYIGREPIVCCTRNETSKTKQLKSRIHTFNRPECSMIVLGGRYEPPGMTDRPTKARNKIIDLDGLFPSLPPSLPPLPLLPLPPLPPPQLSPLPPTSYESLSPPLPSSNSLYPTSSIASLPTTSWPDLLPLPSLPPPPPPLVNGSFESLSDLTEYLDGLDLPPMNIAGGIHADTAEFPHMTRLGIGKKKSNISWFCGGSLISDKFILTAAHCIYSQYGTINWARLGDPIGLRYEEVDEVVNNILHPDYNPLEHYHDIALSELKDKIEFNFYISPACIYTEWEIPNSIRITVSGWGATGFGEEGSEDLLKADLNLYSYEECTKKYPKTLRKLPRGLDNTTHICAGGREEVKDTCQGDSGGPLQMRGANDSLSAVYSIIGVTSFGKICGFVNQPGVYVRIYPYLSWIESVVWKNI